MQTPATYFDGQSAVPKNGTLQILGDSLLFHGPSGDRRWELRQIASVDEPGGETHIAFKTAHSGMPSEKLIVPDPGFAQALQQASTDCGLTELSGRLWLQRFHIRQTLFQIRF